MPSVVGRPQAGLGVRLAQPDGRRAARGSRASVGFLLQQYRDLADAPGLIAMMIVIFVVGIVVDVVLFGTLDRWMRRRHGLLAD